MLMSEETIPCPGCAEGWAPLSMNYCGACYAGQVERLTKALEEIKSLEPRPFAFPSDWKEQIAACPECDRYKDHPIQQGICDYHRRPLYANKKHDEHEQKCLGYRAQEIARNTLRTYVKIEPAPVAIPKETT